SPDEYTPVLSAIDLGPCAAPTAAKPCHAPALGQRTTLLAVASALDELVRHVRYEPRPSACTGEKEVVCGVALESTSRVVRFSLRVFVPDFRVAFIGWTHRISLNGAETSALESSGPQNAGLHRRTMGTRQRNRRAFGLF